MGGGPVSEVKQVIVFRKDLKMRTGKIAAQCTHAVKIILFDLALADVESVVSAAVDPYGESGAVGYLVIPLDPPMHAWIDGLFTAIVLTVDNEADLLRAYQMAKDAGMLCSLVQDAGKTEFKKPCPTCDGGKLVSTSIKTNPMRVGCLVCGDTGKVPNPTYTAIAIGPAPVEDIDKITGPEGAVPTKLA